MTTVWERDLIWAKNLAIAQFCLNQEIVIRERARNIENTNKRSEKYYYLVPVTNRRADTTSFALISFLTSLNLSDHNFS